ncbi:MAG: UDP-N-acetylglucosamine--N-acetylmuramyl-(pentapeptide) pyrophosphoryl-undecaprenol N-acetylglucosamine transferase [Anaerolineales bacterium]
MAVVDALGANTDVLWIGAEGGIESALVARAGLPIELIPASAVVGVGWRALPSLFRHARGVVRSRAIIRSFQPDVMFFTGGYVTIPPALAGWRIPKLLYVPDIEPGLALRVVARFADTITVTSSESRQYYKPGAHIVVTGYPTRSELKEVEREVAKRRLGLKADMPTVLVMGGSTGARSINQALWTNLPILLTRYQVLHLTGSRDWPGVAAVQANLDPERVINYHPLEYMHDIGLALACADVAVARGGAAVMGEFPLFGLPSILVPYPHSWRYQRVNAEYMQSRGAALLVEDEFIAEKMADLVIELISDTSRLDRMRAASRALAKPDAAQLIAAEIERLDAEKEVLHG